jgi:hypothetical protein
MVRLATVLLVLSMAVGAAAQTVTDCYNGVGIFTTATPDLSTWWEDARYQGPLGEFTAYAVLLNPYNEHSGQPITTLGGFEFRIDHPPVLFVVFEPNTSQSWRDPPDFLCGGDIPVIERQALLITITVLVVDAEPARWFIRPVADPYDPAILGEIAVADADDPHTLSRAIPVTYDFDVPVFCMYDGCQLGPVDGDWGNCRPVPTTDRTWGELKALYR